MQGYDIQFGCKLQLHTPNWLTRMQQTELLTYLDDIMVLWAAV